MKEITYVDFGKFEQAIRESGLDFKEQAGFVKVMGQKGRNIYVARTKRVGRVDVSGFEFQGKGVVDLGDDGFGNVHQQLDFDRPEEEILDSFVELLRQLSTQPPAETRARRGSTAEPPSEAAQGARQPRAKTATDQAMANLSQARGRQRRPSMTTGQLAQADQEEPSGSPRRGNKGTGKHQPQRQ